MRRLMVTDGELEEEEEEEEEEQEEEEEEEEMVHFLFSFPCITIFI